MKFITTLLLLTIFSCSCAIRGSFRGLYSYYDKSKSANPGLYHKPTTAICDLKMSDTPAIFITNGIQVSQCISNMDEVIVYIWAPRCGSKRCYPLNVLQEKCSGKNISLFIVSEYFDNDLMNLRYRVERPVFGIDVDYYKTNLTSGYLSLFLRDLGAPGKFEHRFLRFKKGIFVSAFDEPGLI